MSACIAVFPTRGDLVTSWLVDPRRSRPRLAVFAFRGYRTLKQKHRCAFQVLSRAKQFARLGIKIWAIRKG